MTELDVPAEVWGKIFELCCNDGGRTGSALALVSRHIHAVSKPYRYHIVALKGEEAIFSFSQLLDKDPECHRVKHLFVSTFKPGKDMLNYVQYGGRHRKIPRSTIIGEETENPQSVIMAHMYRILERVASSLETLHTIIGFQRSNIFFSTVFPNLTELTIQGSFQLTSHDESSGPPHSSCTKSLCRLYLTDVSDDLNKGMYEAIKEYAPYLTHLRVQAVGGYTESSALFLQRLLPSSSVVGMTRGNGVGSITVDKSQDHQLEGHRRFPETLERILHHPGPKSGWTCGRMAMKHYRGGQMLRKVAAKDPRIVLLNPSLLEYPFSMTGGYVQGHKQWLDRIMGGLGCWNEENETKRE